MTKLYLDTESAGLKGPLHLIQWRQENEEKINIIRPIQEPEKARALLKILQDKETVLVAYNAGHDLFKLYQFYRPANAFPCLVIDLYYHTILSHPLNKFCLYSKKALVVIKKVHNDYLEGIQGEIAEEIDSLTPPGTRIYCKHGEEEGEFTTLSFTVRISARLKDLVPFFAPELAQEKLAFDDVLYLPKHVKIDGKTWKEDTRYPFVLPEEEHLYGVLFEKNEKILDNPKSPIYDYARNDVIYLSLLEKWLLDQGNTVESNYNDSCVHAIAWTKFHGLKIDVEKTKKMISGIEKERETIREFFPGMNLDSSPDRLKYLRLCTDFPDMIVSSRKDYIEEWLSVEDGDDDESIFFEDRIKFIKKMLKYKSLGQKLKQLETFLISPDGKIHPDFRAWGTTSGRMSGTGGFNTQGVSKDSGMRELVYASQGGDFSSLEIKVGAVVDNDPVLLDEMKRGIDPHMMAGAVMMQDKHGLIYEELMKIYEDKNHQRYGEVKGIRGVGKTVNFGIRYGATEILMSKKLKLSVEETKERMEKYFYGHYPIMKKSQSDLEDEIATADFETWGKSSVSEMSGEVSNLYGEKRFCWLEKHMAAYFWENSGKIEKRIDDQRTVVRQEYKGIQTIGNSIRSAYLGAAGNIQRRLYRQLLNYKTQSTASTLTKKLFAHLWEFYRVPMICIHDEIIISSGYEYLFPRIEKSVEKWVKENEKFIPTLEFKWKSIKTWAGKG